MITTTLSVLVQAEAALGRLAEDKLTFQTAYHVAKLLRAVTDETRHFHDERNKLVREYGEIPDGGKPDDVAILPTSPHWPQFVERVTELGAVAVSLALEPLDLAAIPNLTIAAADLIQLGPLKKE